MKGEDAVKSHTNCSDAARGATQRRQQASFRSRADSTRSGTALSLAIAAALALTAATVGQSAEDMISIGAGDSWIGCGEADTECYPEEKPGGRVYVNAFKIDRTEVTVQAYRNCVQAGKCSALPDVKYISPPATIGLPHRPGS